jgi:hypothetical protein
MNNEEKILNLLEEDDSVVVDRGFRDTVRTMNIFNFKARMPDFIKGNK